MNGELEFRLERGRALERARLAKGWTKERLADKAGYDSKTLYNLLSGRDVHEKTVHDFCKALDISVPVYEDKLDVADAEYGGYNRSNYKDYEGFFFVYRPSFKERDNIYKYVLNIAWDEVDNVFKFKSYYKIDRESESVRTHTGTLYISPLTNLVHFLVSIQGTLRLVTTTKMRSSDGIMRGAMASHFEDIQFHRPVVAPIIIKKMRCEYADTMDRLCHDIHFMTEADPDFTFAREQISFTEKNVIGNCLHL